MTQNTLTDTDVSTLRDKFRFFDEKIYHECVALYSKLSPENYCKHATRLLNGPTVQDSINTTAGLRAVAQSSMVYALSSDGLITLSLFYLVFICEGILMPHIKPLITLCEQLNYKGPMSKKGIHEDLRRAQTDFGQAIAFLATHGRPVFLPESPTVGARFQEYEHARLSKLRNSIAHLNFRLETTRTDIKNDAEYPQDPIESARLEEVYGFFEKSLKVHNPHRRQVVDSSRSFVRWEGSLGKPVTKSSASISFKNVREVAERIDAFAFSLATAFLDADFDSKVAIGICMTCNEGHVVVPSSETQATCPACGTTSVVPR